MIHDHAADGHTHAPTNYGRMFGIAVALNLGFVVLEVVMGFRAGSLALLSDAGHNLSDVAGLLISWGGLWLAKSQPTAGRTYGFARVSILAALANAVLLLVAVGAITWEAGQRLIEPTAVAGATVLWVALGGIVINAASAALFMASRRDDLNINSAFLHMAADAAVSGGVVIGAVAIIATGWLWLDPAISLVIAVVIVYGTWGLLRSSLNLAMDAVPENIDRFQVERYLADLNGVTDVHDLHIWALGTTQIALTAHLVRPQGGEDRLLTEVTKVLHDRFGIHHATLQVECGEHACRLAPDEVI